MIINDVKKFKTLVVSVRFKEELNKENASLRALLPDVMSSATKTHNTTKKLNEALESLYGSSISSRTYRLGKISIIDFSLNIINPSFMEEGFFNLALNILNEIIFLHNKLPKKYFEQEKRLLLERIDSVNNHKTLLALTRLYEHMFKDQRYAIKTMGEKEEVLNITYEKLNNYYKKVINHNDYDVIISGDVTNEIKEEVNKCFKPRNNNDLYPVEDEINESKDLNVIKEKDYINQVKLNIGYNFNVLYGDKLYNPAILFNLIFGGSTASRLFTVVREKHNLCYYISSSFDPYKGFLYIYAGIDKNKIDLALDLINEELNDLKTNLVKEEELNLAKNNLLNDLKELKDNQNRWINSIYQQRLLKKEPTLEAQVEAINSIKVEDIKEVAQKVVIDTIYMLEPEEK